MSSLGYPRFVDESPCGEAARWRRHSRFDLGTPVWSCHCFLLLSLRVLALSWVEATFILLLQGCLLVFFVSVVLLAWPCCLAWRWDLLCCHPYSEFLRSVYRLLGRWGVSVGTSSFRPFGPRDLLEAFSLHILYWGFLQHRGGFWSYFFRFCLIWDVSGLWSLDSFLETLSLFLEAAFVFRPPLQMTTFRFCSGTLFPFSTLSSSRFPFQPGRILPKKPNLESLIPWLLPI